MAIIETLKDQSNNIIYPQTHINAVLNSSGDTLDTILATKVSTNNVGQYLPPATTSALGGVKVDGVTITATSSGVISAVPGLNIKVVQVLPTTGISTTTIYLLANGGTGTNVYDEYVYVNNKWEKIGTTDIDLSEYAKKTELPTSTSDLTNDSGYITKAVSNLENYTLTTGLAVVALSGNYNDLSNKPTIPDVSGLMTKANPTGTGSFSLNRKTNTTIGDYSFAEGYDTTATGPCSHAEGYSTIADNENSHAEGSNTIASGSHSHAEGINSESSGWATHAEGYYTTASGLIGSHAEGSSTTASEVGSHAEGSDTIASGTCSHAEGYSTTASGPYSHASGSHTTAQRLSQFVFGEYNLLDSAGTTSTRGTYVEIIGNGTSNSARSNAYTLDWEGNGWFAGKVNVNSTANPTASQVRNITCSTSEPTSADGQNGDLWIVYEE